MPIIPERISLEQILNDSSRPPLDRVMAGDALRYLLIKEEEYADDVAHKVIALSRGLLADRKVYDAVGRAHITLAPNNLHNYLIALEWRRPAKSRFYQPRMAVLRPVVDTLTDMMVNDKYDIVLLSSPPRIGKLLSDDTPVLTSAGWSTHGALVVGDRVISPDGRFVAVTRVFPKGLADRRVTFTNGAQIQCHSNHEWQLYDRSCMHTRVVETGYLEQSALDSGTPGVRGHRYRFQLPQRTTLVGVHRDDLAVDPYSLGVWLGDGTNTKPLICGTHEDVATIVSHMPYARVWDYTQSNTGVNYAGFETALRTGLSVYGMCRPRVRTEKHIPDAYLIASKPQRLALLAGLLDTDGCLRRAEHRYDFSTTSERLRDGVIALASTFGWRTSCIRKEPCTSSSGIVGKQVTYTIAFNPTESVPCHLPRKQLTVFSKPRRVALASIEIVEPKQGNCISVEGGMYCVGKHLTPTHNSSLGLFFLSWCAGRNPDDPILATGYAEKITKMFHTGLTEVYEDPEYQYHEIFPRIQMVDTSAKDLTLDFRDDGKPGTRKYKSITCRAIDGSLTGATEARQLLYCDDLVRDIEEAMSPTRLNMLRDKMVTNVYSRKKEGCKELHIGTRWSIHDPIGFVERMNEDDPRCKVIRIPALDEDTGESNFDYPYNVGFSTAYYNELKRREDDVTWQCVYQQQPIERAGLLFPADDLKYTLTPFTEEYLRDNPPDDRFAFCDVAFGGGDYLAMPIAYQWGNDPPVIVDVVYTKGDYKESEPLVAGTLISRNIARVVFEANNGGDFYSRDVTELIATSGHKCQVTTIRAPSNKSKETRIVQHSPAILDFVFLDPSAKDADGNYSASPMYRAFLMGLTSYTMSGKNPNDDAPDSLAGLAAMQRTNLNATVTVFNRAHI